MGKQLEDLDPEMLENLDLLLNFEVLQDEDKWPLMEKMSEEDLKKAASDEDGEDK